MRLYISWASHNRKYSIGVAEFLKQMGIEVTDEQLVATAKKLLEQQEVEAENPDN
jgi:hypothetical protein